MTERNYTLLCDFYELTMGNGYLLNGKKDKICYFDVFFRLLCVIITRTTMPATDTADAAAMMITFTVLSPVSFERFCSPVFSPAPCSETESGFEQT